MARPADPNAKIDLLRAAEEVFVTRGLERAKVEEITDRARRSKGAFYLHFDSKEDAFRQIVETFLARLAEQIDRDHEFLDENPGLGFAPENFTRWLDCDCEIFEYLWQNRKLVRLIFEGGHSGQFAYLIEAFGDRNQALTVRALEWGKRQGIYRADLDVPVTSLMISGAYDRVARDLVKREHKPDLRKLFAEVQRFVVSGLASPAVAEMVDQQVNKGRNRAAGGGIGTGKDRASTRRNSRT